MEREWIDRIDTVRTRLASLRESMDYESKKAQVAKIEKQMAASDFWNDQEAAQNIVTELKGIKSLLKPFVELDAGLDDLNVMVEMSEEDPSIAVEVPPLVERLEKDLAELELSSLLNGRHDPCNAIIQINARDGGTDANDWAEMLLRMYIAWAEDHEYTTEILDRQDNEEAGINSATLAVRGYMAYGWLKSETGMHRLVRMSPFNADGKRQTSFASVDVSPEVADSVEVDIREEDVREDVYRSSGAGGQHVNKTSSAIRLTHIPTGISVQCQNERSQHKNRALAWKMLRARLARIEEEKREAEMADKYKNMAKVGFGSQIRSYFQHPDQRIKDARTEYSETNFANVMNGKIQGFIDAYLRWRMQT
ncbi:MAG: peptide chain release factor 2 [Thermoguttaceae bacterium]|nr:peptide chain release factor 2 [Thermoguttaceae bacterium]